MAQTSGKNHCHELAALSTMWGSSDTADAPPPLGTAARASCILSLPLSVLRVPLSAAATGGAIEPFGALPALRQRAGYPLCPNLGQYPQLPRSAPLLSPLHGSPLPHFSCTSADAACSAVVADRPMHSSTISQHPIYAPMISCR
jgi:hypothetical protein